MRRAIVQDVLVVLAIWGLFVAAWWAGSTGI
jgi:hypothetical protein